MKTTDKYILKGKKVVPEYDLMKWARWFETAGKTRIVRQTQIIKGLKFGKKALGIPIKISTVFLGLDHSFAFGRNHIPILFETMIFGGKHDQYQERYATWEEAEKGHKKALKLVKESFSEEKVL